MESSGGTTIESHEGGWKHLGRDRQGAEDVLPSDCATTLMTGKTFPNRTEGSVKKHWYKVCSIRMLKRQKADCRPGYALCRFRRGRCKPPWRQGLASLLTWEGQSAALLAAIKEYEASKWKVIGQKVGKPAKVRSTSAATRDVFR